MNRIQVIYGSQAFIIEGGIVSSYTEIVKTIVHKFNLEKIVTDESMMSFCYTDQQDNTKIEVRGEKDFQEVIKYHSYYNENALLTLEALVSISTSPICVDDMLTNLPMSESLKVKNHSTGFPQSSAADVDVDVDAELSETIQSLSISSRKDISTDYSISIQLYECQSAMAISAGDTGSILIEIVNNADKKIYEEIFIYARNSKHVKITPVIALGLESHQRKRFQMRMQAQTLGVYEIDIHAHGFKKEIAYQPLKIEVHVVHHWEVEETNMELFFASESSSESESVRKLPREKKIGIYSVYQNRLSTKKVNEVHRILEMYNFNIDEAIDDLTK